MSLIPEKPLIVSPSLAATIGLEEALLLQQLSEFMEHHPGEANNGYTWLELSAEQLKRPLPFWNERDIQRIANSLRDKGIILIGSAPFSSSQTLRFALNEAPTSTAQQAAPQRISSQHSQHTPSQPATPQPTTSRANLIGNSWQPDGELLRQLAQYNIPAQFALDQVAEFVTYWSERGEPQRSWGSKFIKQVLRQWREQQSADTRKSRETAMHTEWRPSVDATEILVQQAAISANFIEDAIPEFVLYWCERGERSSTWNSRFILHVKRQWARFTAITQSDSEPRAINADWQPDETVFDVLALANIDRQFAEQQIPEFVLYWKDTGRVESSWNTRFLQQVKRQWAAQSAMPTTASNSNETRQRSYQSGSSRNRSVVEQLTDRSWAS